MKLNPRIILGALLAVGAAGALASTITTEVIPAAKVIVYTVTSPYHNITVADADGRRTLYFDDTMESRMNLQNPVTGAFEYTDYFQMPWLWNPDIKNVLMVGLGGASTQKAYAFYYPTVTVESAEIDPRVAEVAQKYFALKLSDRQKLTVMDGRQFLQRNTKKYDLIIMDAYTQDRYGASLPPHLVTKEFFELARDHLTPNGVLAYNVISTLRTRNADIVSAMYHTLKEVFPNVYIFRAKSTLNVILIATQSKTKTDLDQLRKTAAQLVESKKITFPNFVQRLDSFDPDPPADYEKTPVLTDDFAPVESLTSGGSRAPAK